MFNSNFGGSSLSVQNKNAVIEPTPEQRNELFKLLLDDPMYYSVELPLILPDTTEDRAPFAKATRVFRNSNFGKDVDDYDKKELMVELANNIIGTIREKKLKPKITDVIVGTDGVDGYTEIPVSRGLSVGTSPRNVGSRSVGSRSVGTDAENVSGFIEGVYVGDHRLFNLNERGQRVYQRGNRVMSPRAIARQNATILNELRGGSSLNGLIDDYIREQSVAETSSDFFDRMDNNGYP